MNCSRGFPGSSADKESKCNAGHPSSIPESGSSLGEGIGYPLQYSWVSPRGSDGKDPPAMWETWVRSLGQEDSLEEGMAGHSSILARRIPMDRGAWRAAVPGSQRVRHDRVTQPSTAQWAVTQTWSTPLLSLLHCRQFLYHQRHLGNPYIPLRVIACVLCCECCVFGCVHMPIYGEMQAMKNAEMSI